MSANSQCGGQSIGEMPLCFSQGLLNASICNVHKSVRAAKRYAPTDGMESVVIPTSMVRNEVSASSTCVCCFVSWRPGMQSIICLVFHFSLMMNRTGAQHQLARFSLPPTNLCSLSLGSSLRRITFSTMILGINKLFEIFGMQIGLLRARRLPAQ